MDLGAQTPTLSDVIERYSTLRVEDYQRTYSWQREQIDELLLDLIDCATSEDSHFFGTLILQEGEGRSATIVDGQQRLTTLTVMAAVLARRLLAIDQNSNLAINTLIGRAHV